MSPLELLDAIAAGQTVFDRDEFPDLDDIDADLRAFADWGFLGRVVRAVYPTSRGHRLLRIDVIDGLTPVGELWRERLLARMGTAQST